MNNNKYSYGNNLSLEYKVPRYLQPERYKRVKRIGHFKNSPADKRRYFDVVSPSFECYERQMDVKTTVCLLGANDEE